MRIAVFGATGMLGSRIADEAARRGHEVTRISRTATDDTVHGDLTDAAYVRSVAAGHDALVSATGPSRTGGAHEEWLDAVRTLIDSGHGSRIVAVGGAGSLEVDGGRLVDSPTFPEASHAEALSQAKALDLFRAAPATVDWTYLSPAPMIAPGVRTGRYVVGTDSPAGPSISAEDYAVALVDEIEAPQHRRTRFTVAH